MIVLGAKYKIRLSAGYILVPYSIVDNIVYYRFISPASGWCESNIQVSTFIGGTELISLPFKEYYEEAKHPSGRHTQNK